MFGISMPELLVILVVALLVLGPKRLPEVARFLGKSLAEFRRATADITEELTGAQRMIEDEVVRAQREANLKKALEEAERGPQASQAPPQPPAAPGTEPR